MKPAAGIVEAGSVEGDSARVLALAGKAYAVYLHHGRIVDGASRTTKLTMQIPQGRYTVEWLSPKSGRWSGRRTVIHGGGSCALESPVYTEDVALLVRAI
jgi:hypothetical protein